MTLWIHANIGAEEPLRGSPPPAVACVAELFQRLFPGDARRTDGGAALSDAADDAAFPWLDRSEGLFAWLNDDEALRTAQERDVALLGPSPEVVRRVHDKAFALRVAQQEGYEARSLRGLIRAFDPEVLADGAAALAEIRGCVDAWPDWTEGRFCLKPRLGGSGRGRVAGRRGGDLSEIEGALPRLAQQGGALLEPWLQRERDLSAQLHVGRDGTLTLLASFEQRMSPPGVYQGHAGRLDHRLRVSSGHAEDGDVLEAASAVARAAHAEGFHGPCGVDAFVFHGERGEELRPVVELNARFTTGTLLAGLLRRAREEIEARLPAPPGETRRLGFALRPPPSLPEGALALSVGTGTGALEPTLWIERERR